MSTLFKHISDIKRASLLAQKVKSLTALCETQVRSLDQEDPLEKEMANHASILSWKIPWTEEPGRLQPMGSQRVWHDWAISLSHFHFRASLVTQLVKNLPAMQETWVQSLGWGRSPREGKGCPLQYSGLENSMDCIVHGVTKSQTHWAHFTFTARHQKSVWCILWPFIWNYYSKGPVSPGKSINVEDLVLQ